MADAERSHPGVERAERAAAMLAAAGMPRMPARVMMALVGSPDEGYSAADLAERLGVSPAAVSGAVRYLESMRMVHRLSRPGERIARFDLIDDGWRSMVISQSPMYGRLADDIDAITDDNADAPASEERARDIAGFLRYLEKRMPELVVEWQESTGRSPTP